jgi:hypothetical protein
VRAQPGPHLWPRPGPVLFSPGRISSPFYTCRNAAAFSGRPESAQASPEPGRFPAFLPSAGRAIPHIGLVTAWPAQNLTRLMPIHHRVTGLDLAATVVALCRSSGRGQVSGIFAVHHFTFYMSYRSCPPFQTLDASVKTYHSRRGAIRPLRPQCASAKRGTRTQVDAAGGVTQSSSPRPPLTHDRSGVSPGVASRAAGSKVVPTGILSPFDRFHVLQICSHHRHGAHREALGHRVSGWRLLERAEAP